MTQTELTPTASLSGKWKPYSDYKDSGVEWLREIPVHWELSIIKRYLVSLKDGTHGSFERVLDGVLFLSAKNVANGKLEISDHESLISYTDYETINRNGYLKTGDLLLTIVGTIGRAAIFSWPEPVAFQRSVAVLRFRDNQSAHYFYYLTQSSYFQTHLLSRAKESAQSGVYLSDVCLLPVLSPPLLEQHAIAAFLDRETARINALIAKKERLIELLQEKRAALISHAVTKGLDPTVLMKDSGVEWLGEIPEHWEVKRMKFVTSFVTSGSRGWAQYYSDEGAIFLRIGNLSRTSIALDFEDIQHVSPPDGTEGERTRVKRYDVLTSITANIGSVAVVSEDIGEAYVNQHIALTRPRRDVIDSKWLGYCLLSRVGQEQFYALLYGGTKDGLGLDDVRNLFILAPSISEQLTIANYLNRETAQIDALISRIHEGIEKLKEYNTALISAAVTGKIDVRGEITSMDDIRH